ncbi:MAG TPA: DUF5661 family protein [Allocoleopsis sp.]
MKITKKQASILSKKFSIDHRVIPFNEWHFGLNVELEHGKILGLTNITDDNLEKTAKIVLAHIIEYPDYYKYLKKMEEKLHKYWKGKVKPDIFKKIEK